jgi:hypothetical protein
MSSAVYRPRVRPPITSYISDYVDRVDLEAMLDKEFLHEEKGVMVYEYFIHVGFRVQRRRISRILKLSDATKRLSQGRSSQSNH